MWSNFACLLTLSLVRPQTVWYLILFCFVARILWKWLTIKLRIKQTAPTGYVWNFLGDWIKDKVIDGKTFQLLQNAIKLTTQDVVYILFFYIL